MHFLCNLNPGRSAKTPFCDEKRTLTFSGSIHLCFFVIASEEDETSDGIAARGFVNGRDPLPEAVGGIGP